MKQWPILLAVAAGLAAVEAAARWLYPGRTPDQMLWSGIVYGAFAAVVLYWSVLADRRARRDP